MKPAYEYMAAAFFILIFTALSITSSLNKSATVEEFAVIPAGLYTWKTFDSSIYPDIPAGGRMLITAAAHFMGPQLDTVIKRFPDDVWRPWVYGTEFMRQNFDDYGRILMVSRLGAIFVGLLLCLAIWRTSREGYGEMGGLLSLAACALSPTLIAHTQLATTDVMAALFSLVFVVAMMSYFDRPAALTAFAMAVALGLTILTQFICLLWVVLALAAPPLSVLTGFTESLDQPSIPRMLLHMFVVVIVTWMVIVGGYLGQGLDLHQDAQFQSPALKAVAPVARYTPLPRDFLFGLDKRLSERGDEQWSSENYLLGEWYKGSKWNYYAIALATKVPVSHLALFLIAAISVLVRPPRDRDEILMLLSILLFFVAASFISTNQTGIKYLLPVYPMMFMLIGKLGAGAFEPVPEWPDGFEGKRAQKKTWKKAAKTGQRVALIAVVAWMVVQHALIWPNYLAYFNLGAQYHELERPAILLDSNLDWGQDLPGLAKWMEKNQVEGIDLAYFGHDDPARHKISYTLPGRDSDNGYIAISANLLMGKKYPMTFLTVPIRNDDPLWDDIVAYGDQQPEAVIGHSIYVYSKIQNDSDETFE